jgi:hypothetical protein
VSKIIHEPDLSGHGVSAAEHSLEAVLPPGHQYHAAWRLDPALILAPGSGESVLEASRRIEEICRWAHLQVDWRRASGLLPVKRTGVGAASAPAWDLNGRVACP